jgi:hypothetical protein
MEGPIDFLNENAGAINWAAQRNASLQRERHLEEQKKNVEALQKLQKTEAERLVIEKKRLAIDEEEKNIRAEERRLEKLNQSMIKDMRILMVDIRQELDALKDI